MKGQLTRVIRADAGASYIMIVEKDHSVVCPLNGCFGEQGAEITFKLRFRGFRFPKTKRLLVNGIWRCSGDVRA